MKGSPLMGCTTCSTCRGRVTGLADHESGKAGEASASMLISQQHPQAADKCFGCSSSHHNHTGMKCRVMPRCSAAESNTQRQSTAAALSQLRGRTCAFSSARTSTAALLFLARKTGVRPAMLPRLERLLETRADVQGTLTTLELAATCMTAAVRRCHLVARECPASR